MYLLLVNPQAGGYKYKRIERSFKGLLDKSGVKYKIVIINSLADIPELLKTHLKNTTKGVVAVGGNGTATSIIDALVDYNVPFGVIPISKTNTLAHNLGINTWQKGVNILKDPKIEDMSIGKIGKKYFIGSLSIMPKRHLFKGLLAKQSWFKSFIGSNLSNKLTDKQSIEALLKIDDRLEVSANIHDIEIHLRDEMSKRLQIIVNNSINKKPNKSIFRANKVSISSNVNMPILSGNEIIANTPASIKALSKTVPVIKQK